MMESEVRTKSHSSSGLCPRHLLSNTFAITVTAVSDRVEPTLSPSAPPASPGPHAMDPKALKVQFVSGHGGTTFAETVGASSVILSAALCHATLLGCLPSALLSHRVAILAVWALCVRARVHVAMMMSWLWVCRVGVVCVSVCVDALVYFNFLFS